MYVKLFLKFWSFSLLDNRTDFKEKFLISLIILSDFIGSDNTDGIVVFNGMSFFSKKTFFCVLILFESNVTMVGVGFFLGVFPVSFSWEKFNVENFTKIGEIFGDFFFGVIIRDLVDINLMIGETFFKWDCFACNFDVS